VSQRSDDVSLPSEAQRADGEVAQRRHHPGVVPVQTWEASWAKVASRTQCGQDRLWGIRGLHQAGQA